MLNMTDTLYFQLSLLPKVRPNLREFLGWKFIKLGDVLSNGIVELSFVFFSIFAGKPGILSTSYLFRINKDESVKKILVLYKRVKALPKLKV